MSSNYLGMSNATIGNDGVIVNQPETDTEVIFTGTSVLNAVTK